MSKRTNMLDVGTLRSVNSLNFKLSELLKRLNAGNIKHSDVQFDLSHLEPAGASLGAITAFLAISHKISRIIQHPIPVKLLWNPYIIKFLKYIDFFSEAAKNDSLVWDENIIGGFREDSFNPYTKIKSFHFEIPEFSYQDIDKVNDLKTALTDSVYPQVLLMIKSIFPGFALDDNTIFGFIEKISRVSTELIVNSILHGKSTPYFAVQRAAKRISICISDAGIGFLASLKKTNQEISRLNISRNVEGIAFASLLRSKPIGLTDAIDAVIANDGWISISSIDCEVSWTSHNWESAKNYKREINSFRIENIIPQKLSGYVSKEIFEVGFYRIFPYSFWGSHISFEVPLYYY